MVVIPTRIAPSILAADFARLGEQVREADAAGANLIHVDVMDGRFVPNITMGPLVVEAVRRVTDLPLDVHLMIVEPERHIDAFARAGANRITVHVEATAHLHRVLQQIQSANCQAGVAINPQTSANAINEVMHMVDVIIVMTVNPGFGGQLFLTETMPKIKQVRTMVTETGRAIDVAVDGGIDVDTAPKAAGSGANVFIAGSSIFNKQHSVAYGIDRLREVLHP